MIDSLDSLMLSIFSALPKTDVSGTLELLQNALERVKMFCHDCYSFPCLCNAQIVSCPKDSLEVYRRYMRDHHISNSEHIDEDGTIEFVIDKTHDPHSWDLPL